MRPIRHLLPCLAAAILLHSLFAADPKPALPPAAVGAVDFVRDVQPIFALHCLSCHGSKKQISEFRLDRKAAAMKGGEGGIAIVPGKARESALIRWVAGHKDEFMPPKGPHLTAAQVGILMAWIDRGADWPETAEVDPRLKHWAFQTPKRPAVPAVKGAAWVRTPIDAFVLAKLEKEGLAPSAEADRTALIRRLYLDLLGLPPTVARVDAFVADRSPKAWETLIEEVLSSPHYGERWARHWLDVARYADSDGYEKDKSRQMWFYRDWAIDAFNRDMPWNRFVLEQIAGDLLPNATQDQIVATGFLRNSMLNEEGGVDPEQFRMDAMFDRMEAIGKGILGLTIQCAQCHTHKFDPITHNEYYSLFAFLNNDHETQRVVYAPTEAKEIAEIREAVGKIEADRVRRTPDIDAKIAVWEQSMRASLPGWRTIVVANKGDNSQRYTVRKDGSILAQGYAPTKFTTHLQGTSPIRTIGGFRLELLNDPNLPCDGPGRSRIGTAALTEFGVEVASAKEPTKTQKVKFVRADADYSNPEKPLEATYDDKSGKKRVTGPIDFAIDGKEETAWGIDRGPGRRNRPRNAVFVPEKPIHFGGDDIVVTFYLKQMHGGWNSDDHMNHNLGCFRLGVCEGGDATADPLPPSVRAIFDIPAEKRTPAQKLALFGEYRKTVAAWQADNDAIEGLLKTWPEGFTALTLDRRDEMRDTRLLKRGDFLKPGGAVSPGTPAFLHRFRPDPNVAPRLNFARWLTDPDSPTISRVLVNRVWQTYFGNGLVASAEDLGVQAEIPSHPELLDWLAVEFQDRGWSVKELHRSILRSSTYRQSSKVPADLLARDPYNRLLARFPRLRVEGEIVRDIALAESGLLDAKVGGASLFSPAPEFLFRPPASYGPFDWKEVTGADRYRRALYTFRRRSTPYPMLANFDVPNADSSCVRRSRSNSPLQALTTLNEVVFVESARALGRRMAVEGGPDDTSRIRHGFRVCLSRAPSEAELTALTDLYRRQVERTASGRTNAIELLTGSETGKVDLPTGIGADRLAGYVVVARVIMNLDENISRE